MARVWVKPYTKADGTKVKGFYRNSTKSQNKNEYAAKLDALKESKRRMKKVSEQIQKERGSLQTDYIKSRNNYEVGSYDHKVYNDAANKVFKFLRVSDYTKREKMNLGMVNRNVLKRRALKKIRG